MINLAARDILHSWGKFVFTGVGLGLLIGATLTMAGVYRGMVDDAQVLLANSGADIWVVRDDTLRLRPRRSRGGRRDSNVEAFDSLQAGDRVVVHSGLAEGARIVVYSEKELTARSNTHVVDRIVKGAP